MSCTECGVELTPDNTCTCDTGRCCDCCGCGPDCMGCDCSEK